MTWLWQHDVILFLVGIAVGMGVSAVAVVRWSGESQ